MSQHVNETCNESNGIWLPLTEYAVRSGVSLSTIRRKIKTNSIAFRLEKGRYLIRFAEGKESTSRFESVVAPAAVPEPRPASTSTAVLKPMTDSAAEDWVSMDQTVRMVSQAFEHALKEKDERVRLLELRNSELEERLNELRTLVRVLEEKYEVRY